MFPGETGYVSTTGSLIVNATFFDGTLKTTIVPVSTIDCTTNNTCLNIDTITFTIGKNELNKISVGQMSSEIFTTYVKEIVSVELLVPSYLSYTSDANYETYSFTLNSSKTTTDIGTITFIITKFGGQRFVYYVSVIVQNELEVEAFNFNFEEGKVISLYINTEATITIGSPYNSFGASYVWYSLNTNVKIQKISSNKAKITAGNVACDTTVMALYTTPSGNTISGSIQVIVLESLPEIGISIKSSDDSVALNIYQLLEISFVSNGFAFSNETKYTWYLDDVVITSALNSDQEAISIDTTTKRFFMKFSEGTHNIKVSANDAKYNIIVDEAQNFTIVSVIDKQRVLKLNHDKTIYALLDGEEFKLEAYLDDVINSDFSYIWNIYDQTILNISMSSNTAVLLKPKSVGKTKIIVSVDVGTYTPTILKQEITVEVVELKSIEIVPVSEFYKPGNDGLFNIKYNNLSNVVNGSPTITIETSDGVEPYTIENSTIKIDEMAKGVYNIKLSYNGYNISKEYTVTNFNFRQLLMVSLPYMLGFASLIILVTIIIRLKKNPLIHIDESFQSLLNVLDKEIESISKEKRFKKWSIKKIMFKFRSIQNSITKASDEEMVELVSLFEKMGILHDILLAGNKSFNKTTDYKVVSLFLRNVKNNNIMVIYNEFEELKNSREKFEKIMRDVNKKVDINNPLVKHHMTKEEYALYLEKIHYTDDAQDDE